MIKFFCKMRHCESNEAISIIETINKQITTSLQKNGVTRNDKTLNYDKLLQKKT